ncbi:threonine--tRNA ligase, mitochondrial 1 [Tanacetum coccineum]
MDLTHLVGESDFGRKVSSRSNSLFLLQLDFQLPQRFNLNYIAEDESKRERPVMIHRAILGSVERMFAILLEHYKGKWPFWLSPRQAIVCPVTKEFQVYGQEVKELIDAAGYYVDIDSSDRTIQKKVREAQLAQYNYILVVGKKEVKTKQVSVRVRDKQEHSVKSIEDLLKHFKDETYAFHYPLEIPLDFEEDVLDDEVQRNEAIPLSDEEIALDASSEGTLSPGGPRYDYMMSSEEAEDDY